ncbi:hypothetical protein [Pseudovibrio sp. Tun.PSC04-5.I4]|uniref:hypothetical protein n=1 Tax=Pseudovibrio sp. Tun.PSC04-5.I4 TaxID=1798213 RepID=UPI00088982F8|nr:hypothetical protein [Pseudovibrio sp. Tun.PSC04-5.I4]SDR01844.1 hypothetical protein SAMN04515695_2339 [Pseudovibrio sp. Tun.PSC04-5.I4]
MLNVILDFMAQHCEIYIEGGLIHLDIALTQKEMDRLALFGSQLGDLELDD